MKSVFRDITQDDTYGPGTDLAIALLGIFILYMAINIQKKAQQSNHINIIMSVQEQLIKEIAEVYHTDFTCKKDSTSKTFIIKIDDNDANNIIVQNSNSIQTLRFGNNLLFDLGQANLKLKGQDVVGKVGLIVNGHLNDIEQIQIQGHADTLKPSKNYDSNMELASARATTVFQFLQMRCGIDPAKNLMSIVSFGEYKPVQRENEKEDWSKAKINEANSSFTERDKNRRIEIVLIYK